MRKKTASDDVNLLIWLVCVSDTLVAEIKRIVKESEILKYVSRHSYVS